MVGTLQQDIACSSCVLLQACADSVRFLDERKAGMVALLDRTVRDATLQLKVAFHGLTGHPCWHVTDVYRTSSPGFMTTLLHVPCSWSLNVG